MKKIITIFTILSFLPICLAGCKAENIENESSQNSMNTPSFEEKHLVETWDEDQATNISFFDDNAKVDGEGAVALAEGVKINKEGVYILSGDYKEGRVVVNTSDEEMVTLVLNNVNINCSNSSPINIVNGDAHIIIPKGSENRLTSGENYEFADPENEEPNACIFADDNLSIVGSGKLEVNAGFNNGIGSKNELRISGGNIVVSAKNNAIKGNECVLISGGNISINSEDDGIKSDGKQNQEIGIIDISGGKLNIVCKDDAFQAMKKVSIKDCEITLKADGKIVNCDGNNNIDENCFKK